MAQQYLILRKEDFSEKLKKTLLGEYQTKGSKDVILLSTQYQKPLRVPSFLLAASSDYFKEAIRVFEETAGANLCPVIIFLINDVVHRTLEHIVDFILKGEVEISEDRVATLMKTAQRLKIKGLTELDPSKLRKPGKGSKSTVTSTRKSPTIAAKRKTPAKTPVKPSGGRSVREEEEEKSEDGEESDDEEDEEESDFDEIETSLKQRSLGGGPSKSSSESTDSEESDSESVVKSKAPRKAKLPQRKEPPKRKVKPKPKVKPDPSTSSSSESSAEDPERLLIKRKLKALANKRYADEGLKSMNSGKETTGTPSKESPTTSGQTPTTSRIQSEAQQQVVNRVETVTHVLNMSPVATNPFSVTRQQPKSAVVAPDDTQVVKKRRLNSTSSLDGNLKLDPIQVAKDLAETMKARLVHSTAVLSKPVKWNPINGISPGTPGIPVKPSVPVLGRPSTSTVHIQAPSSTTPDIPRDMSMRHETNGNGSSFRPTDTRTRSPGYERSLQSYNRGAGRGYTRSRGAVRGMTRGASRSMSRGVDRSMIGNQFRNQIRRGYNSR